MRSLMITSMLALLVGSALSAAAGGVVQTKDGKSNAAFDIQAETVSGIIWETAKDRPGARIRLWDLDNVAYKGQTMDEFNGLARKLTGGRGDRIAKDAKAVMTIAMPSGFDAKQWERIKLSCQYYVAMGDYLQQNWSNAVSGLEEYIKACEKPESLYESNIVMRVSFNSKVSGKAVTNGGGLNRYYLDALEALGMAYIKQGDAKSAAEKAFKPLQELTEALSSSSGDKEYFDWAIRALRASARNAEDQKDFKGARENYDDLARVALKKQGGRASRTSYEAQLKVGFMEILEGNTRGAKARFLEATQAWTAGQKAVSPPRNDWINSDLAYLTAGSFVGQGLVIAATAKKTEEWSEALENFSTSLSIFNADDEIRSLALLGAANAAAQLAALNSGDKGIAKLYATLSEKYLSELTQLLPKTKAAESTAVSDIQRIINTHK